MMRTFLNVVLIAIVFTAASYAADRDGPNYQNQNNFQGQFQTSSNFGNGNSFMSSGTHSFMQGSGGNNVVISRRMGPNQQNEDYISIASPSIRIDGDYCKRRFNNVFSKFCNNLLTSSLLQHSDLSTLNIQMCGHQRSHCGK